MFHVKRGNMAFKSNWKYRGKPFAKRKVPWKALPRSVARKRSQWITVYNAMQDCGYTGVNLEGESCVTGFTIALLENDSLQELFQDACTVTGIRGSILFRPFFPRPNTCDNASMANWEAAVRNSMIHLRAGLVKQETSGLNPEGISLDPSVDFDWAETRWSRQWDHIWRPKPVEFSRSIVGFGDILGVCSNTTKAATVVPPTASGTNPGWIDSAEVTNCAPYVLPEGCSSMGKQEFFREHPWWSMGLNSNKRYLMKDSDELNIHFAVADVAASIFGDVCFSDYSRIGPCNLHIYANIRIRVEYG